MSSSGADGGPHVTLPGGLCVPQLAYGVYRVAPGDTQRLVETALAAGFRHIDTASYYGNEREVGRAIAASGLAREDVVVTTKLWNDDHQHDRALAALGRSLDLLGLDHLDLYLVHWPLASRGLGPEAWAALVEARARGLAAAVGVSNFRAVDLQAAIARTGAAPEVNQIELHPTFSQPKLRSTHRELGIVTGAWAPLGVGEDLAEAAVFQLAERLGATPAQVVLRWHLDAGRIAVVGSRNAGRIAENIAAVRLAPLTPTDSASLDALDRGNRLGPDPTPPARRPAEPS